MKNNVLVIGAGPAGLAIGGSLLKRGLRAKILEKSEFVGNSWRTHYERLHLHTIKSHSALPGLEFSEDVPKYPSRQAVVDYLDRYAEHFGIRPEFGTHVAAIKPSDKGWAVTPMLGDHYEADAVVVASGANAYPRATEFPSQSAYEGEIIHSDRYQNAFPFEGRRVLVVGMGNTGAEIALDLLEQGVDASLSVRSPLNIVRRDVLGRPTQLSSIALSQLPAKMGDSIATLLRNLTVGSLQQWGIETADQSPLWQLRELGKTPVIDVGTIDRIKRGEIEVYPAISELYARGAIFSNGQSQQFDVILLATGYEAKIERLFPETSIEVDRNGMPISLIGSGSCAGLFFIGFDIRQPGGLLRTISKQAEIIADALTQ